MHKSNKCWELQHKSGTGKCAYKTADKKPASKKNKELDECNKNIKKDDTCPEGHKYRTINPDHKSVNYKYCYNLPACAKSNKCWELQHKSGSGKCAYKTADKKPASKKNKELDECNKNMKKMIHVLKDINIELLILIINLLILNIVIIYQHVLKIINVGNYNINQDLVNVLIKLLIKNQLLKRTRN